MGLGLGNHGHDEVYAPSLGSFWSCWSCSCCCSWADVDDDNDDEKTKHMEGGDDMK
jgi:hypothetical protein